MHKIENVFICCAYVMKKYQLFGIYLNVFDYQVTKTTI